MTEEEKHKKFDVVIGNPPYQEETSGTSKKNGQKSVKNIFQLFQEQANLIAKNNIMLIYPGGRWIHRFGKGLADFGLNQINDPHLKELTFYPNASEVFDNVAIADGISIVNIDLTKTNKGFTYKFIKNGKTETIHLNNPGKQLMPLNPNDIRIVSKIDAFVKTNHLQYLHDAVLPRSLFGIESSYAEDHPDKVHLYHKDMTIDYKTSIKLFTNNKAGKAGRATWFVADRNMITKNTEYIDQYQVVVSSANAGGQKRDNQLEIMPAGTAYGRSRVALRSFKTLKEAQNFKKYLSTMLVRYTFLMTDEALSSLAKRVPDLTDYSDNNSYINFDMDINKQLCDLIGISNTELDYITDKVTNFRKHNHHE